MTSNTAGLPPRYLRTPEAARFLGLSDRTLEKHRTYGTGPAYRKLGGRVVYSLETSRPGPTAAPRPRPLTPVSAPSIPPAVSLRADR